MNGATQVFFIGVAYGHLLSGVAGGSGGDEPNHPWHPKSAHEADAAPPPRRKPAYRKNDDPGEGPFSCPVCGRRFISDKAAYGHMRSHPERPWRGMKPPRQPDPAAAAGRRYYACERCGAAFETRQALGGHRASHNGKRGCFLLSRQEAVAAEPRPVLAFDLNDPVPPEPEEEEEEAEE